jgi:hypothetical protein
MQAASMNKTESLGGSFLHLGLGGEAALLPSLRLTTLATFLIACVFAVVICVSERQVYILCSCIT